MKLYISSLIVAIFSFLASASGQNLISDGDFETPVLPPNSFQFYFATSTLGPWTVSSGIADHSTNGYGGFNQDTPDGDQFLFMGDSGPVCTIFQDISTGLGIGNTYSLSFLQAPLDIRTTSMLVELFPTGGGANVYSQTFTTLGTTQAAPLGYQVQSDTFTVPTSGNYTLRFTTPNNTPAYIDAIALVPEPGSAFLVCVGFGMLGLRRRASKSEE